MRLALALGVAAVLTGCGGGPKAVERAPEAKQVVKHLRECTHVSGGYRACSTFSLPRGERSWIQRREGARWKTVLDPPPVRSGWWRRIMTSPDRRTVLAQWSGECEIQSTYVVSAETWKARPIFRWSSSTAVGWAADGRARVRLPAPVYGTDNRIRFWPGIYLVEPETMAISRERSIAGRPGC
jgi:hypothetical protein